MNAVERVKIICKERKIPISKLESDCGFANGYIGQLRKGVFPDDRILKISEYLNVSVDYLMTGKDVGIIVEKADKDSELLFMENRIKEYALKLSKLSEEDKIQIMNMIDRFGKWGTVLWIVENVEKKWESERNK